jgi:lycopene cyclase domain-containing protein
MKQAYLLIDFFTIIVPFVFSFHPKLYFYRTWKAFFPAVTITGIIFVVWDFYFTNIGVWGFNPNYLIGIYVYNLPVEELLFFLCVPYSCVFTFYCITLLTDKKASPIVENIITFVLLTGALVLVCFFYNRKYTAATFILLIILLAYARYYLKITWLGKFYMVYSILLIPFLIVNGILTGTGVNAPIVWYNHSQIIGIRILTIPVEDVFYGMDLVFFNLLIYNYLNKISSKQNN